MRGVTSRGVSYVSVRALPRTHLCAAVAVAAAAAGLACGWCVQAAPAARLLLSLSVYVLQRMCWLELACSATSFMAPPVPSNNTCCLCPARHLPPVLPPSVPCACRARWESCCRHAVHARACPGACLCVVQCVKQHDGACSCPPGCVCVHMCAPWQRSLLVCVCVRRGASPASVGSRRHCVPTATPLYSCVLIPRPVSFSGGVSDRAVVLSGVSHVMLLGLKAVKVGC
jgi:hypothetical protein